MAEAFDPYHKWLAIPPEEQPPDLYRLLALPRFESDPDVIAAAADHRMMTLRTYQAGPHGKLSQKLLNEVAAARICLLNAEKKAAYDRQLREALGAAARPPIAPPPVSPPPVAHRAPPVRHQSGQTTAVLEQLGEYKLLEKLGQGGMGTVYKAVHVEMDRVVAVKVLPPSLLQDEHAVARFKREIKAVAQLDHPNIVRAHDAREIEGVRFLVLEYVEGTDVADLAKRTGPLPVADACEIIRQAALGLQCAHEHGLVHRDVKPSNLMLTPEGRVKLLDLGLARPQAHEGEEVTGTGEAMGTVDYMGPEQIVDSRSVDIRADIYSLGSTLYRLLAGRAPFSGPKYDTSGKKLLGHMQDRPEPIAALRPDVPPALALVVERMMAKQPDQRFATPGEVAAALKPFAADARLRGLAAGKTRSVPVASQAERGTAASQSSGLTQFFQTFRRKAPAPGPHAGEATGGANPVYLYIAVGGVALLILVALGLVVAGRSGGDRPGEKPREVAASPDEKPKEKKEGKEKPHGPVTAKGQYLVFQWPASERDRATMWIDEQPQDLAALAAAGGDAIRLAVQPGPHTVSIVRAGYEPFDARVTVAAGKEAAVRPEWKKATDVVVTPEPKTDPKPEEKPKPPEMVEKPAAKPEEKPKPPEVKIDPVIQAREQKWREAMKPVEELAAAWDFAGAQAGLAKVKFEEPELQARHVRRADELKRMASLKAKMIARIKAADPRLKKRDLMLKGMSGEVTGADEQTIHATLASGKSEDHPWAELNEKARPKLLELAISEDSADDWLAGGLMAFAAGDVPLAEKLLDKAKSLGADPGPYLGSLAAVAFANAGALLEQEKWIAAQIALTEFQAKYGSTPWFASSKPLFDASLSRAKSGIYESEAEKLYVEAKKLSEEKDLFDLRDVIQKLKADYPQSRAVTDLTRKPPFTEMEKATANLGKKLVVRQDGTGDHKGIQAAIDAAEPNTLIQIEDSGHYNEKLVFSQGKDGITLRGARKCWPVVTSIGSTRDFERLVDVSACRTTLERLVFLHGTPVGGEPRCVLVRPKAQGFRMRFTILWMPGEAEAMFADERGPETHNCLFLCNVSFNNLGAVARDCVFLGRVQVVLPGEIRRSTICGHVTLCRTPSFVSECILPSYSSQYGAHRVENCDILSGPPPKDSQHSFTANPLFRDPQNLDFRLGPKSPCIGKASDGGDIGCRYTPEMIEMCKIALELRAKGIIKF